jgi:hypothetical protein
MSPFRDAAASSAVSRGRARSYNSSDVSDPWANPGMVDSRGMQLRAESRQPGGDWISSGT